MEKDTIKNFLEAFTEFREKKSLVKEKFGNLFFGSVGALITLLLVGQWNTMEKKADGAMDKVEKMVETMENEKNVNGAKFRVLTQEISKLEAIIQQKRDISIAPPLIQQPQPEITFKEVEVKQKALERQVDKEIYRSKE